MSQLPVSMKIFCRILTAAALPLAMIACEQSPPDEAPGPVREPTETAIQPENPLLERYLTPYRTPPFHRLQPEHFLPALEEAIGEHEEEIEAIIEQEEPPTFDNTVAALEAAGADLSRIARTYFGLNAVSENPELHEIAAEFSTRLSAHNDTVLANDRLFERLDAVYRQVPEQPHTGEQQRLLRQLHASFRHAGAELSEGEQERLRTINTRLAELGRALEQAMREATHRFELVIDNEELLEGLPEGLINLAGRSARDRGHDHGWAFTLYAHSFYPALRHFSDRELRRELYEAWRDRTESSDSRQNAPDDIMHRMASLRAERAELLGYDSHIDYQLAGSTLGDRERLRTLLDRITEAARERVEGEMARLRELAEADRIDTPLQPWDWWYYNRKLGEAELALDNDELRQWFALEQVRDGAFALANRLWGLSFHERSDFPLWSPEVDTFEVRDARGDHLGVIYLDYPHRAGKQGGAWTSVYRSQHYDNDERVAPVIANVTNFPPPAAGLPALLSPEEVRTLFHEFGHALHELFSDVRYRSMAGSAVPDDFVEFPAQLMELWALRPEVLRMYAFHHETGSTITDEAVSALQQESRLLPGLETLQFVAAIELDLALHGVGEDRIPTMEEAEQAVAERLDLPGVISPLHHGNGLSSLFSVRREGGDYRTLWSEILARDAFAAFAGENIMDRELSARLRDEVLSRGNARDPMESWEAFRGRAPEIEHFLDSRGLGD